MWPMREERLRKAIEVTIDARIAEALKQFEQHIKSGATADFKLKSQHLNDAATRLQSALGEFSPK